MRRYKFKTIIGTKDNHYSGKIIISGVKHKVKILVYGHFGTKTLRHSAHSAK